MILERILRTKVEEVAVSRAERPLARVRDEAVNSPPTRDFAGALTRPPPGAALACIAEVKKASPSRGVIRADFDPVWIARRYADSGASALSVLTDVHYFQGALAYLELIRKAVSIPLLRKDFVIDPYQIYEARAAGADAVLLIVAAIPEVERLREYRAMAEALGMAALVEIHSEAELELALASGARLIGINNRDLRTFETSLEVTMALAPRVPAGTLVVAESGIGTFEDCQRVAAAGARAVLVGESLMRQADPGEALRRLMSDGGGA